MDFLNKFALSHETFGFLFQKETKSYSPPTQDQNYNEDRFADFMPEPNLVQVASQLMTVIFWIFMNSKTTDTVSRL